MPGAWWLLLRVRTSVRVRGYNRTAAWLGRLESKPARLGRELRPARIARLVEVTSHLVPAGRQCLSRSLALATLLRRRGHVATVDFGVARGSGGELDAHAWVSCDGEILLGGDELERFSPLTSGPAPPADRSNGERPGAR